MSAAADVAVKAKGKSIAGGDFMICCPAHGHDDNNPSCKVFDGPDGRAMFHCFAGCDWRDVRAGAEVLGLLPEKGPYNNKYVRASDQRKRAKETAASQDTSKRIQIALSLWDASVALPGMPGAAYFAEHRGLNIDHLGDLSHALRWHVDYSMIVALMRNPVTGEPCGVHRTLLNLDGSKRVRLMLGRQGVVHLSPDDAVSTGLGITEGVEDGLAVLLAGWRPIWATTSSGAIRNFPVLSGIEALTVFADCDSVGTEAARECADRWLQAGCEAKVSPPQGGAND